MTKEQEQQTRHEKQGRRGRMRKDSQSPEPGVGNSARVSHWCEIGRLIVHFRARPDDGGASRRKHCNRHDGAAIKKWPSLRMLRRCALLMRICRLGCGTAPLSRGSIASVLQQRHKRLSQDRSGGGAGSRHPRDSRKAPCEMKTTAEPRSGCVCACVREEGT